MTCILVRWYHTNKRVVLWEQENWMEEHESEKNNQHFLNELHFYEQLCIFISVACET